MSENELVGKCPGWQIGRFSLPKWAHFTIYHLFWQNTIFRDQKRFMWLELMQMSMWATPGRAPPSSIFLRWSTRRLEIRQYSEKPSLKEVFGTGSWFVSSLWLLIPFTGAGLSAWPKWNINHLNLLSVPQTSLSNVYKYTTYTLILISKQAKIYTQYLVIL